MNNKPVQSVTQLPYWNYFVDLKINDEKQIRIFKSAPCEQVWVLAIKQVIIAGFYNSNESNKNIFKDMQISFKYVRS